MRRIPKVLLDELDLGEGIELSVHANRLVIQSLRHARQGSEEKFRTAIGQEEGHPPFEEFPSTAWNLNEWEW